MVEDAISFWTDIQRYENMLAADPRSYCFAPLSELYRKLGLLDDAISVAEKGCKLHPDYPGGFFALGSALSDKGIKDQARQALERAVELKPDAPQALKLLGQIYVEAGVIDRAKVVLKQLLQQSPDDTESSLLLQSISAGGRASEEEVIEELDLLEDLEPLDEAQAAAPSEKLDIAESFAELDAEAAPAAAEPEIGWGFGPAAESEAFWAIEASDEEPAQELSRPFEEIEELEAIPPVAPQAVAGQKGAGHAAGRDPLTTATLAELYVSQGFLDKALAIYRELLGADPGNQSYRFRCGELADDLRRQQEQRQGLAAEPVAAPGINFSPPQQEPAAVEATQLEAPISGAPRTPSLQGLQGESGAEQGEPAADFEGELQSWLDNIRRRRDGV
jgi:tetratricopeptide (TPR) repeat protein